MKKLVISAIACVLLLGCQASSPDPGQDSTLLSPEEAKLVEVWRKVGQISEGMARSEVEMQFKIQDGGIQGPSPTRYYEKPQVMIEVPYDQNGGNWSPKNRVTGKPKGGSGVTSS